MIWSIGNLSQASALTTRGVVIEDGLGLMCRLMSYLNPSTFEDSYILPTFCEKALTHLFFRISDCNTSFNTCTAKVHDLWKVFLGKTLDAYFLLGPSSLLTVEAQPEERIANRIQKSAWHHKLSYDFWLVEPKPQSNDVIRTFQNKFLIGQRCRKMEDQKPGLPCNQEFC